MDKSEVNLLDVIKKAVKDSFGENYSKVCKVTKVDTDLMTCNVQPIDESAPILKVRLIAGATESPLVCIPKVDSMVVVTFLNEANAYVAMFSDIETVAIRGDKFGGLIKIEELKKQLDVVTSRIDTVYDAIKNAVPISQDGGVGLQKTMVAKLSTQLETENFDNIENELVKHG
ncbi:MAG: hypothetical protein GY822_27520 [Deltaproteobacteria bacterium]|nr:hypothetical protein [Deltaproteobacteria bacterium]